MRRLATTLFVALMLVAGGVSSGYPSETTTTETVERPSQETVVEEKQTTETKESDGAHFGIISGTIHAIGWVLALPFRIVGGLIRVIF